MRSLRVWALIVFVLMGCGALWADGCFIAPPARTQGENRVASTEQKGVIIGLPDGDEVLLLQTTYHGPADEFAWLVPVPGEPGADEQARQPTGKRLFLERSHLQVGERDGGE